MRITRVRTLGWGGLEDGELVLAAGLNFIQGPNEAGKSFTVQAILAGLFADATTESEQFLTRFRRWGEDGDFLVELDLEDGGETYTVTRDFGEKRNRMRAPDGKTIRDKRKIVSSIEAFTGLSSVKAFTSSACVLQEDLPAVCGEAALKRSLERQVVGSAIDIDGLIKRLERDSAEILSKSERKGRLADLRREAEALQRELTEKKTKLAALSNSKRKLATTESQLTCEQLELETDEAAFSGYAKFIEARARQKQATIDFEVSHEAVETFLATSKEMPKLDKEVKSLTKRIKRLNRQIAGAVAYDHADYQVGNIARQKASTDKDIQTAEKTEISIAQVEEHLKSIPDIRSKDFGAARKLEGEIKSLKKAIGSSLIEVKVEPENDSSFTLSADGKPAKGAKAKAHIDAEVRFPEVGTVKIRNLTGGTQSLSEQLKSAQESLAQLLDKYGAPSVAELEKLYTRRQSLQTRLKRLEDRMEWFVREDAPEVLEYISKEFGTELAKAEKEKKAYARYELSHEELDAKRKELDALQEERSEKEAALNEAKGVLGYLNTDERKLVAKRDEASKRLAMANAALRDTQPFRCTPSEYAKLERRLSRRRQKVEDLSKQVIVLEARIAAGDTIGQEDVAAVEERLCQTRSTIERFENERSVLETIAENVRLAREAAIEGLATRVERRMGALLSTVTETRYSSAKVDGNLEMAVFSPEKSGYVGLGGNGDRSLSTGARDLMYVAARLALVEALDADSAVPLILDDTFANFDGERRDRAFEVLEAIARERQVLFCTCHKVPSRHHSINIGGSKTNGSKK
jgi:DNA repair exonuclease SbcCD ATPase subunit